MTRTVTVDEADEGKLDGVLEVYDDVTGVAGFVSEARIEGWRGDEAVDDSLASDALEIDDCGGSGGWALESTEDKTLEPGVELEAVCPSVEVT